MFALIVPDERKRLENIDDAKAFRLAAIENIPPNIRRQKIEPQNTANVSMRNAHFSGQRFGGFHFAGADDLLPFMGAEQGVDQVFVLFGGKLGEDCPIRQQDSLAPTFAGEFGRNMNGKMCVLFHAAIRFL